MGPVAAYMFFGLRALRGSEKYKTCNVFHMIMRLYHTMNENFPLPLAPGPPIPPMPDAPPPPPAPRVPMYRACTHRAVPHAKIPCAISKIAYCISIHETHTVITVHSSQL